MKLRDKSKKVTAKYKIFNLSVGNEIAIDRELLTRLRKDSLSYTPVRSLKLLPILERFKVGVGIYRLLSILFAVFMPVAILFQFTWSALRFSNSKPIGISENILLVANGRAVSIFRQVFPDQDVTMINVNQNGGEAQFSLSSFLNFIDILKAFLDSYIAYFYFLIRNRGVTNIPQLYVTFDWFIAYHALQRMKEHVDSVCFSNHYDRWAVLFDFVFSEKQVCLLQHGVLPEQLELPYKLRNLSVIYAISAESESKFRTLYSLSESMVFRRRLTTLPLSELHVEHGSALIIGQPHSLERELALIRLFRSGLPNVHLCVKPHPLYSKKDYEAVNYGYVISEKEYFPKVDVAVCLESTLGVEYEQAGIEVLWWHSLSPEEMFSEVAKRFS